MINIKSKREIELMKESGHINFLAHEEIKKHLKIGVSLNELNDIVDAFIRKNGAIPSELNYEGFPKSVCLSLNDEVVHGIPSDRKLKNGDIVEIITSDKSKGPSRDWLKFIKSSTAKTRIQQWFKKNERVENIARGKDFLEKEVKKIGMSYPELFRPEFVEAALERYKYNSADDMFASVGFGTITANKIVSRVLEEYRKVHKEENLEEKIEELTKEKTNNKPSTSGVIVKGIDNCLVKLSKCCNPVPGDEIVGYITKGRGVSVHRKDCKNVKDLVSEENRMIDVSWYTDKPSSYNVDVVVFSNDRDGLLADIIATITAEKTPIMAVSSKVSKERIVLTELTLEVSNIAQLNSVLKAIRKIDSVYEVRRNK